MKSRTQEKRIHLVVLQLKTLTALDRQLGQRKDNFLLSYCENTANLKLFLLLLQMTFIVFLCPGFQEQKQYFYFFLYTESNVHLLSPHAVLSHLFR